MPEQFSHPSTGLNWVDQLSRHAFMQADGVALRYKGETTTWATLDDRSRRLAAGLADVGVRKGDRVIILITNRPEFVEALIAVNRLGAVAVPINFRLVASEVAFLAHNSGSVAIVVEQDLAALVASVRADADREIASIVVGDNADQAGPGSIRFESLIEDHEQLSGNGAATDGELALICYTSGTTGRPKGAMLTYTNLTMQTISGVLASTTVDTAGVRLITPPLFHIAGVGGLLPSITLGVTTAIMPTGAFDPDVLLDVLESEQVTGVFLVPTQWQMVCERPGIENRKLALRTISWGASPATPAILRAMDKAFPGVPNICTFGQTEMSPVTTVLSGEDAIRKLGSVGKPVAGVAARIVDAEMNDVPRGEIGEIVYRGPGTMIGYWNNPEATEDAFRGGWFHSGDLVREDEEGFIYVVDRLKDMIISGGENIYSAEVENVISDHPKVREVALVGAPHPRWVETPVAFVVAHDEQDPPTAAEIIDFCQTRLASYKKPTRVHVVDQLPRNASGKILKTPLRDQAKQESTV